MFIKGGTCSLLLLLILKYVESQQYIGDFCTIPSTGVNGQCQLISACPVALELLHTRGIFPEVRCGFFGNEPIVCCAGSASVTPAITPQTVTATRPTPTRTPSTARIPTPAPISSRGQLAVGDKSKQKCIEYGKYVYTVSAAVGLPGQKKRMSDDCQLVAVKNIVGGDLAKAKEFPHMALVGFDNAGEKYWACGGSLISDKYVLTAAHCLYLQPYGDVKYVRLGELVLDTNTDDSETQDFNILNKIKHPDYNPPSHYNDIALLELDSIVELDSYVRPACLNTIANIVDEHSVASGWGKQGYLGDTSKALLKVTLEKFSHSECNNSFKHNVGIRLRNGIVDETQFCAGSRNESRDSCQGDSGGPLQVSNTDEVYCTYRIIGVTSFGKACGTINVPGIYTRVSAYIKWIEDNVWP